MKVGILTPDRGDRPLFLEQWRRMIDRQTLKPEIVELVDYEPLSGDCDISQRYRIGYDKLRDKGLDVIACAESDDVYLPRYLEVMCKGWLDHGKPDIFGICYTVYYHLGIGKSYTLNHPNRSSMMCTLIKPDLELDWPLDDYPYTDAHLWMHATSRATFRPSEIITVGLKHGYGKTGGEFHTTSLKKFTEKGILLSKLVGEDMKYYDEIRNLINLDNKR